MKNNQGTWIGVVILREFDETFSKRIGGYIDAHVILNAFAVSNNPENAKRFGASRLMKDESEVTQFNQDTRIVKVLSSEKLAWHWAGCLYREIESNYEPGNVKHQTYRKSPNIINLKTLLQIDQQAKTDKALLVAQARLLENAHRLITNRPINPYVSLSRRFILASK